MAAPTILCVTLNPVLDTTFFVAEMRPVYRTEARRVTHLAGGKGNNVARALTMLGQRAHAMVVLGGMIGRDVAELLAGESFTFTPIWVTGETRLQITVVDDAAAQYAFFAPAASLIDAEAATAQACFQALLPQAAAVCLCGSSPGPVADRLFPALVDAARRCGVPTLLDSSGEALRLGMTARPDFVKVNRAEAAALLGRDLDSEAALRGAVAAIQRLTNGWAILTTGEEGAWLATDDALWRAWPPPIQALNPIGSGDAMTAGILTGILRGQPADACLRLGMAAAAANALTWEACRFAAADMDRLAPAVRVARG